jgi:hypothetical protein
VVVPGRRAGASGTSSLAAGIESSKTTERGDVAMNTHVVRPVEERPFLLVLMVAVLFAATVFAGVLVIGKGGSPTGAGGTVGPGVVPPVSVAGALVAAPDTPLLVSGLLFVAGDGTVYLTDALLVSYPPQIDAGRSLRITGLDLSGIEGLQHAAGVSWTGSAVELSGTVLAGTLTVDD